MVSRPGSGLRERARITKNWTLEHLKGGGVTCREPEVDADTPTEPPPTMFGVPPERSLSRVCCQGAGTVAVSGLGFQGLSGFWA